MVNVSIKGTIIPNEDKWIYDLFGISSVCPEEIQKVIQEAKGEDLEVEINSGGGDVVAANEIYTALRMYQGKVTNIISGMAASAASYIATARNCKITPVGIFMIHNAAGGARGDYHAMDKESEILQTVNRAIVAAYMEKTHMNQQELLDLMDKESWMTAQEALNYGFVDSIVENQEKSFIQEKRPIAFYNTAAILDRETIEKAKKVLINTSNLKKAEAREMEQGQESIQTVEELTAKYPTLVQQIKEEENQRLKAIDEIAGQVSETMVTDAKYGENRITAEMLALEAFKQNNRMAKQTLSDLKNDIKESGVNEVEVTANLGFTDNLEEIHEKKVRNLANKFKRK